MKTRKTFLSAVSLVTASALLAGLPLVEAEAARGILNTGADIGSGGRPMSTDIRPRLGGNANMPATNDVIVFNDAGAYAGQVERVRYNSNNNDAYGGDQRADANAEAAANANIYHTGIHLNNGLNIFDSGANNSDRREGEEARATNASYNSSSDNDRSKGKSKRKHTRNPDPNADTQ